MTILAPSYDPSQFESRLYAEWEASGVFKPRGPSDGSREPYAILLPPPNVAVSVALPGPTTVAVPFVPGALEIAITAGSLEDHSA